MSGYNAGADLAAEFRRLQDRLSAIERRGGPWRVVGGPGEPAFSANWGTSPSLPLRFRRDANGYVALQGYIIYQLAADSNGVIFTLPVGFRPSAVIGPFLVGAVLNAGTEVIGGVSFTPGGDVVVERWDALIGAHEFRVYVSFPAAG